MTERVFAEGYPRWKCHAFWGALLIRTPEEDDAFAGLWDETPADLPVAPGAPASPDAPLPDDEGATGG